MSAWIVYSKDGKTERCRLKNLEYSGSFMSDRVVTATFEHYSEVAFEVFDYIVYRGEKFELEAIPSVKKTSRHNYEYELRFVSLKYELERCEMRDIVPNDNGIVYPTPLTFSFTGDVRYLAERIQDNLDSLYGKDVWRIVVAENATSEEKNITIGQQNCWNALSLVNTTYGLNFSVKGREVVIGGEIESVGHVFQYGKGNGLYEIERASDTDTGIVTKLRAYGGTRNIDYSYPKQPEWTDSVLPVSFALSPLRLMLPSFKEDGKTDFVLADEATIAKYGIREASIIYEDIYPSITGATNTAGDAIDEIANVEEIDESKDTFIVYLHDIGFDLNEHLTTLDAQLSMKTGTLQGYTFNISVIERLSNGGYKLTLGRNSLEDSDESGAYVPSKNWNMKAGDKFVLLNILMPQAYIREAEQRLLVRAKEYLNEYGKTNFSYNIGLHDKFLVEHSSVYDSLVEGVKLSVYDNELGIDEDVTIQSITITEYTEDNVLPQVKVTLNNKPSASTLDRIQGKLNDIANETAANSFSTQSELMKQYRKKLDKPFFDKLFAAVDAEGKEIASNDISTSIAYIKAKYDFLVLGGVTTYYNDDSFKLPDIYDGLPIDWETLYWELDENGNKVKLKAKGGEEGTIKDIIVDGTGNAITDVMLTSDGKGLVFSKTNEFALKAELDEAKNKFDDFLEGSNKDDIINKWSELEVFLEGLSETDNLARILSGKANQSDLDAAYKFIETKWTQDDNAINQWNTAYSWGNHAVAGYALNSYVDSTFVKLKGYEKVEGVKNFLNGIEVGGLSIGKLKDGILYIDSNVVISGGLTQYADLGNVDTPSIYKGLPIDGTTIYWDGGVLKAKGGESGITHINSAMVVEALGYTPYSAANPNGYITSSALSGYATQSWVSSQNFAVKSTTLSGYGITDAYTSTQVDNLLKKYLPLSGGTITGDLRLKGSGNYGNTLRFGDGDYVYLKEATDDVLTIYASSGINLNTSSSSVKIDGIPLKKSANDVLFIDANVVVRGGLATYGTDGTSFDSIWDNAPIASTSVKGIASFDSNFFAVNNGKVTFIGQTGGGGIESITKQMVIDALGYTPYNSTNPNGYITSSGSITGNAATATQVYVSKSESTASGPFPFVYVNSTTTDSGNTKLYFHSASIGVDPKTNSIVAPNFKGNASSATKVNNSLSWSGYSSGSFDGSAAKSITIPSNTNQLTNGAGFITSSDSITGNAATATTALKLSTVSKEAWGKTYWTSGGVPTSISGDMSNVGNIQMSAHNTNNIGTNTVGVKWIYANWIGGVTGGKFNIGANDKTAISISVDNKVGIGNTAPTNMLDITQSGWNNGLVLNRSASGGGCGIAVKSAGTEIGVFGINGSKVFEFGVTVNGTRTTKFTVDASGNGLFYGGMTQHSDIRKKTKLADVELTLKQIADAPLIEHYYNSDEKKTTHVGSVAQYWAGMNDWFCKLDKEGFYTMELQNAALASAISVARHLQRYETKTDKTIRQLKKRISHLEDELLKKGE